MSVRGLLVALLCGLIGLAGGAAVAYAVSPHATDLRAAADPIPADLAQPADRRADGAESRT